MTTLFRCAGLARRPWFEGFSLELAAGEIAVLRGATGSGKTLCMRALADLDPADAGEATLEGQARQAHDPVAWRRAVLYVHPSAPTLPGSVRANLAAVPTRADDAAEGLPALDLEADAERLSSGERQLLALARALRADPRVLLLDEGTSHLDRDRARVAEATVRAWVDGGRACLWTSHDDELAGRLGAREVKFP